MLRKLSIIILCYNEERTVAELLRRVEAADLGEWEKEVIIVDDGSRDGSRAVLERYRERPWYHVIFRPENGGPGIATREAINVATGEYVIRQDADLEYNPQEIRKLLAVVEADKAPLVLGSRALKAGWYRRGFPLVSIGAKMGAIWMSILSGVRVTDPWTCYKLFSREVAQTARFLGDGFEADYLFLGDAILKGIKVTEVPIGYAPRTRAEGKKIRYRDGIRAVWRLLLLRLRLLG